MPVGSHGYENRPAFSQELLRRLFELVGYMVTSARGLFQEPPSYGPFRLIEGASRLCALLEKEGLLETEDVPGKKGGADAQFYSGMRKKIEERKFLLMSDLEGFKALVDELVIDFTRKLKEK